MREREKKERMNKSVPITGWVELGMSGFTY